MEVCPGARIDQVQPLIEARTEEECAFFTDESKAYNRVRQSNRHHATVKHPAGEFARDDDGDGINEVHCNSAEGLWTGVRNFIRPFRGVHKRYLAQYIAVFENAFNFKEQFVEVFRAITIPDFFLDYYASP